MYFVPPSGDAYSCLNSLPVSELTYIVEKFLISRIQDHHGLIVFIFHTFTIKNGGQQAQMHNLPT